MLLDFTVATVNNNTKNATIASRASAGQEVEAGYEVIERPADSFAPKSLNPKVESFA